MAAGILGKIEWFRNHNSNIVQQLKKYYKRKKFQKYARINQDLSLCARSDCWADKPGMITIGARCEIFGTLYSSISPGHSACRVSDSILLCYFKVEQTGSSIQYTNAKLYYDYAFLHRAGRKQFAG